MPTQDPISNPSDSRIQPLDIRDWSVDCNCHIGWHDGPTSGVIRSGPGMAEWAYRIAEWDLPNQQRIMRAFPVPTGTLDSIREDQPPGPDRLTGVEFETPLPAELSWPCDLPVHDPGRGTVLLLWTDPCIVTRAWRVPEHAPLTQELLRALPAL